ncbi:MULTISPECIES: hypothetical protein [Nostocales]|nr:MULTISPECIES: hypothetical protein [Nostocales]MCX5980941.1 hypothetical protein [Nostocales cyanobacterium LacPavin_0920_SED1_MAG_38_18]
MVHTRNTQALLVVFHKSQEEVEEIRQIALREAYLDEVLSV